MRDSVKNDQAEEPTGDRAKNQTVHSGHVTASSQPYPTEVIQTIARRAHVLGKVFVLLIILALAFFGGWLGSVAHDKNTTTPTSSSRQIVLSNEGQVISGIAKTVGQSVVSVNVTSQAAAANSFGFGFGLGGGTQTQQDEGTGIIISADGLIITNRHVVPAGATSVSVTLSDGTEYNDVQVVGRTSDQDSLDIAFLKIKDTKGKTLVPAPIGDSSGMQVGDPVVAIGNALGQFQNSVTSGIISGHGRSVQASDQSGNSSENLDDLFQTDAAINEGNSGGPLVNLSGQVIGINTAIASGSQNIGFAIPINDVSGLIKTVEQTGKLQRPYLGVVYVPLTSDLATQNNLSVSRGAYVPPSSLVGQTSIIAGGPADKAGLKEGDIITQIDGTTIDENTSLTSILDKDQVGQTVTLTIVRSGKTQSIKATLGAAPTG